MQQNGIAVDMVGPKNNWTDHAEYNWNGKVISYDPANAGYSGYAIMQYPGREGIYETIFGQSYSSSHGSGDMITAYDPDVILLQIGTNDLLYARFDKPANAGNDITGRYTMPERLEMLVDAITEKMDADAVLFVSTVPDIDVEEKTEWLASYGWLWNVPTTGDLSKLKEKVQDNIDRYNESVKKLVQKKQKAGIRICQGDVHSCIDLHGGDLYDGVHPSEQGYARMGEDWAGRVTAYERENAGQIQPEVPMPTQTTKPTQTPTQTPKPTQTPPQTPKPTQTPKQTPKPTQMPTPTPVIGPSKKPERRRVRYSMLDLDGSVSLAKRFGWN
jgi:lysophospholipase L1-like esterase